MKETNDYVSLKIVMRHGRSKTIASSIATVIDTTIARTHAPDTTIVTTLGIGSVCE